MKKSQLVKTTLITLLLSACSSSGPVTADSEDQTATRIAQRVSDQIGIYPAEFLTTYIDAIGRRLTASLAAAPYYFRFRITDRGTPNAFTTPGGYIYLSRGLLTLINTEDELAGILAHLISHVTQQHQAHHDPRNSVPGILASPGSAIRTVVGEDINSTISGPLEAIGKINSASYNNDQENDADRLGMELAARAGYDPAALAAVLTNINRTLMLMTDGQHRDGFFSGHPTTDARITRIKREAASLSWTPAQPFANNQQTLLDRLDGLPWGADNPMQGILRGQQFMQPDMAFSIAFPDNWQAVNTPIFVGALAPENRALVILGGTEGPGSAKELAAAFIEKLHKKADLTPAAAHPVDLDAGPAYLVHVDDASGGQRVSIYYLWANTRSANFRLIAVGSDSFSDQLRNTILSLRNMTDEEKASIVVNRIRSVAANAGESLQSLSTRTGNDFSPELTAAVNGLSDTAMLNKGQLIKIMRRESYLY